MTTNVRAAAVALAMTVAVATVLTGCSSDPETSPTTKTTTSAGAAGTASPPGGGDGSVGTGDAVWDPQKDLCEIQDTWKKISPKIDAKQYRDAMLLTQSVFPPDSIKEDWAEYRSLLEDYVAVLETGDQAKIDSAYPETIRITEVRIRYNTAFLELC